MAKTRTVIIQLEVETDAPLSQLRNKAIIEGALGGVIAVEHIEYSKLTVRQVTATVAQAPKAK